MLFVVLGAAFLLTFTVAPLLPGGPTGAWGWVLVVPMLSAAIVLLVFAMRRVARHQSILSREERWLRRVEEVILALMIVAMVVLMAALKMDFLGGQEAVGAGVAT